MPKILIYTKPTCPYCQHAKKLLEHKGIVYKEINIQDNEALKSEMVAKAHGRTTVPQIFINDMHVGGCDDLYALEEAGKLDILLRGIIRQDFL